MAVVQPEIWCEGDVVGELAEGVSVCRAKVAGVCEDEESESNVSGHLGDAVDAAGGMGG